MNDMIISCNLTNHCIQFANCYIIPSMNREDKFMSEILHTFGRKVAELRNKKGLSQDKLAEMIDYSTNHISKLELARTNPSFDLIVKLANALDIELKELFDFKVDPTSDELKMKLHKFIDGASDKQLKLIYNIYKVVDNI